MALRATPTAIPQEMWSVVWDIVQTRKLPDNKNEGLRALEDTVSYCRGKVYPDPPIIFQGPKPKKASAKATDDFLKKLAKGEMQADATDAGAGGLWLALALKLAKLLLDLLGK